jgi:hypothetical protein
MSLRGAEVHYTDNEGKKVNRKAKPRESLHSMKMCHTIGRLALRQQKLDTGLATDDDGDKTLNDFVTEVVALAGDRMADEAEALGLECAAELPAARVDAIFEEEQKKFDAQKGPPQTPQRPGPVAIPADERNDWIIPMETQAAIMTRLADMALPEGSEYPELKPRERQMAGRQLLRFCALRQEQQFVDQRIRGKGHGDEYWEEAARLITEHEPIRIAERKREDAEHEARMERRRAQEEAQRQAGGR